MASSVDRAGWGQRVAMNLTGPERADIARGHVICHEKISLTSDRFDAHFGSPAGGGKRHQESSAHASPSGRRGTPRQNRHPRRQRTKSSPSSRAYCQVTLSEPLLALRGDHFIVRDETARRTLAGGVIVNPWAKRHKRGETEPARTDLQSLHTATSPQLTESFH